MWHKLEGPDESGEPFPGWGSTFGRVMNWGRVEATKATGMMTGCPPRMLSPCAEMPQTVCKREFLCLLLHELENFRTCALIKLG